MAENLKSPESVTLAIIDRFCQTPGAIVADLSVWIADALWERDDARQQACRERDILRQALESMLIQAERMQYYDGVLPSCEMACTVAVDALKAIGVEWSGDPDRDQYTPKDQWEGLLGCGR